MPKPQTQNPKPTTLNDRFLRTQYAPLHAGLTSGDADCAAAIIAAGQRLYTVFVVQ